MPFFEIEILECADLTVDGMHSGAADFLSKM
jgi:hypothetical protein